MTGTVPQWLTEVAAAVSAAGWLAAPFRYGKYLCASDGHVLVCLESDAEAPTGNIGKAAKLVDADIQGETVDIADLKHWVGADKKCTRCRGTNRVKCDQCKGRHVWTHTCSECDGEHEAECYCDANGTVPCNHYQMRDYGDLFGLPIDRALLRKTMRELPAGRCIVFVDLNARHVIITGHKWRIILRGLSCTPPGTPKFFPEAPE